MSTGRGKKHPPRKCKVCHATKPFGEFQRRADYPHLRRHTCKECWKQSHSAWKRQYRKDRPREHADARLKREYGISLEDYENLMARQRGRCAICYKKAKGPTNLHVDHDHGTGDVRGLLCQNCNLALGLFKDSIKRLGVAIQYLREPPAGALKLGKSNRSSTIPHRA